LVYAVEPKSQSDVDRLGMALSKLAEEDPTFRVHTDEDSWSNRYLWGMGELHLEIIVDRLKREFKVECQPRCASSSSTKKLLLERLNHREVYKKQTGGRGKFADIVFDLI
jgi:elongation factor G